uniref:Uncharacterized protein n=1 Tax=Rhizophora mucronata TaxID=61149 RepID=A0A2P2JG67_RHIMU
MLPTIISPGRSLLEVSFRPSLTQASKVIISVVTMVLPLVQHLTKFNKNQPEHREETIIQLLEWWSGLY